RRRWLYRRGRRMLAPRMRRAAERGLQRTADWCVLTLGTAASAPARATSLEPEGAGSCHALEPEGAEVLARARSAESPAQVAFRRQKRRMAEGTACMPTCAAYPAKSHAVRGQ